MCTSAHFSILFSLAKHCIMCSPPSNAKSNSAHGKILINYLKSNAYVNRLLAPEKKICIIWIYDVNLTMRTQQKHSSLTCWCCWNTCMCAFFLLLGIFQYVYETVVPSNDVSHGTLYILWYRILSEKWILYLFTFYCFHSKHKIFLWIFLWIFTCFKQGNALKLRKMEGEMEEKNHCRFRDCILS